MPAARVTFDAKVIVGNETWSVDTQTGRITSPGRFEGEARYVPYFWEGYLNGWADRDDGTVMSFFTTQEDKALFPELRRRRAVRLRQTDSGFVIEV